MMADSICKVLFDFAAQEAGELSVQKGDTVRISKKNNKASSNPGWTLVETLGHPVTKGYVPTGYIGQVSARGSRGDGYRSTVSSLRSPLRSPSSPRNPTASLGNIRRLSDPRLPVHLLETLTVSDANSPLQAPAPPPASNSREIVLSNPAPPSRTFNVEGVPEVRPEVLLAGLDEKVQQVLDERKRECEVFEGSLKDLEEELQQQRKVNEEAMQQMRKLDSLLEQERRKWKEQVDKDTREVAKRVAQLYA